MAALASLPATHDTAVVWILRTEPWEDTLRAETGRIPEFAGKTVWPIRELQIQ